MINLNLKFSKGSTDPVGDCGNFGAGIDVSGVGQIDGRGREQVWFSRVEVYGKTAAHADELRDQVLAAVQATEHGGDLHKAVFMALESYGGADTFRDGVLALVQQSKERGGRLDKAVEIINSWKSVFGEAMARRATLYVETDAFLSGAESPEVEAPGVEALASLSLELAQAKELLADVERRILKHQACVPMSRRDSARVTKIRADIKRNLGVIK